MSAAPKFTPHPMSAPGDFYVEKGQCLACGVPHVVAPDLVGWTGEKIPHCYWKKQPKSPAELERAIAVLEAQELECHRYAGTDPSILERMSPVNWDYPMKLPAPPENSTSKLPQFALLDNGPGLFTRLWRAMMARRNGCS